MSKCEKLIWLSSVKKEEEEKKPGEYASEVFLQNIKEKRKYKKRESSRGKVKEADAACCK